MNSSLPQFKEREKGRLERKVGKSNHVFYICAFVVVALYVIAQPELNHGSNNLRRGWSSMSNYLPAVKAGGGELRVLVESFDCPHCPNYSAPFSNIRALNNHVKWDHELKHLLYVGEEEVTHQIAAKDSADDRRVLHSQTAKDSAGNSSCGSSNSGIYWTATEGED